MDEGFSCDEQRLLPGEGDFRQTTGHTLNQGREIVVCLIDFHEKRRSIAMNPLPKSALSVSQVAF